MLPWPPPKLQWTRLARAEPWDQGLDKMCPHQLQLHLAANAMSWRHICQARQFGPGGDHPPFNRPLSPKMASNGANDTGLSNSWKLCGMLQSPKNPNDSLNFQQNKRSMQACCLLARPTKQMEHANIACSLPDCSSWPISSWCEKQQDHAIAGDDPRLREVPSPLKFGKTN